MHATLRRSHPHAHTPRTRTRSPRPAGRPPRLGSLPAHATTFARRELIRRAPARGLPAQRVVPRGSSRTAGAGCTCLGVVHALIHRAPARGFYSVRGVVPRGSRRPAGARLALRDVVHSEVLGADLKKVAPSRSSARERPPRRARGYLERGVAVPRGSHRAGSRELERDESHRGADCFFRVVFIRREWRRDRGSVGGRQVGAAGYRGERAGERAPMTARTSRDAREGAISRVLRASDAPVLCRGAPVVSAKVAF